MGEKSGKYQAVVIGVSAGGISALEKVLPALGGDFEPAVLIVQHISPERENYLARHFASRCSLTVKEAIDKERVEPATVYFAPANYHLLVENERTLALSVEPKVNFSRPSIDVLFESAAEAYCGELVAVVLTGANSDGANGLVKVSKLGGLTIVQSPETAEVATMPRAAIKTGEVDHILDLEEIGPFLAALNQDGNHD